MIRKIAAVATAGTIAWAGVSAVDNTTRNDSGAIVESGELGAFVTRVGDCLNDIPDDAYSAGVSTATGVPCTEPHRWQVIHKETLDLAYYDAAAISALSEQICTNALDDLIRTIDYGTLQQYAKAETPILQPTAESWENEDRIVDCLIGSFNEFYYTSLV
jgi:hypothetical protein